MKARYTTRVFGALMLGIAWMSLAMAQDSPADDELPSAESVLDRYVEVTGGEDAYESLTSTVAMGTMEIRAAGLTGQLEIHTMAGRQYTKIELPGVGVIESGVRDGLVWESNVLTGPRIVTGAEADITLLAADPAASLHWRDIYTQVETTGVEDVNGEAAYRVDQTMESGFSVTTFYSIESGLLLMQQMTLPTPAGQIQMKQYIQEYAEVGDILSPSSILIDQGVQQVVMKFTSAEANVEIPSERFDPPEDVQALLQ